MSNAGQAVLSIAGAAVGFWLGGPAGAAWGFSLGGMAGGMLFPTDLGTVSGPRLNDLNVMTSTVGAPIPIVYGSYAIAGNLIWSSGIIETVSRKKQGGKGGPTQTVKTYTYKVNCAVGVCEGEIGAIRRIWADAKLVYDNRPQLDGETDDDFLARTQANTDFLVNTEIYLGTSVQLADPTIESFEGVGNVSAFRDLAYVVFSEFQLADYGNRVPSFRFEVLSKADFACAPLDEWSSEVLYPWTSDLSDPRDPRNGHDYYIWNSGSTGAPPTVYNHATLESAIAHIDSVRGRTGHQLLSYEITGTPGGTNNDNVRLAIAGGAVATTSDSWWAYLHLNVNYPDAFEGNYPGAPFPECQLVAAYGASWVHWHGATGAPGNTVGGAVFTRYDIPQYDSRTYSCSGYIPPGGPLGQPYRAQTNDAIVRVTRKPAPPYDEADPWTYVSGGTYRVLQQYSANTTVLPYNIDTYPLGPVRPLGHAQYDDQAFWEAAYAAQVTAGFMAPGLTYGIDYPVTQSWAYERTVLSCPDTPGVITLGQIVRDICLRCGLTDAQIDVSDLSELVDGYAITRVMAGRDGISPLRSYGFFDCLESDGQLKWPTRGKAAVVDLVDDDLAAHVAGDQRPSAVETDRQQEVELPRRLRVHYSQTAQNYEPGEQGASRLAAGDVEVRDIEIAVAMSDAKAAQIAEVLLYDLWISRNRHRVVLDHSLLALEPADALTVPIDGRQERVRILEIDHSLPGLMRASLTRDDDGVYQSFAVGAPAAYAGTGGGSIAIVGDAELVLLDLPALRDSDDEAGYYAAVRTNGNTFGGAVLYRSPDGGTTYEDVSTTALEATLGTLVASLPSGATTIIDEGNELLVNLEGDDELESISEASLLAGLNAAAIGADGRWEIVQFRDAALVGSPSTWRLTGLLRGRRGTEWAVGSSQAGDSFVLLDSALMRVPMNLAAVGASRKHKAVLVGSTLEAATAYDFAGNAVALKPFSPVELAGDWDGPDFVITWIRRDRFGQEMPSGADIPMSESTEAYEVDIYSTGSPGALVRTLTSSSPTVTYTAAQIGADFGSPTPASFTVHVYQLSALVGRGYVAEATL